MTTDTTDQQAVTVAQVDRDEAHAIAVAWDAGRYDEAGQLVARHRLASVSSASAESADWIPFNYSDTPEPVPATNQAEEVIQADRDIAAEFAEAAGLPALGQKLKAGWQDAHDFVQIARCARTAFATQPATSQEGELPAGMTPWSGGKEAPADWNGGQVWLRRGCWGLPVLWDHTAHADECLRGNDVVGYHAAFKGTKTDFWREVDEYFASASKVREAEASAIVDKVRHLLMHNDSRLTDANFRPSLITFAESCVAYVLAASPTPPTLSVDLLRQAAGLVYRIEAAGAVVDEGANFERWKADARGLAPELRAALARAQVTA